METFEIGDIYIGQPLILFQLHQNHEVVYMGIKWERIEGYDESESGYVSGIGLYSKVDYDISFLLYRKIRKEYKRIYGKKNFTEKTKKNYYELHFNGKLLHITICWRWSEKSGGCIGIIASIKDTYNIHFIQYEDSNIKEEVKKQVLAYVNALNNEKKSSKPANDAKSIEKNKLIRTIIIVVGIIIAIFIYAYGNRYATYKGIIIDKWKKVYITPTRK